MNINHRPSVQIQLTQHVNLLTNRSNSNVNTMFSLIALETKTATETETPAF